MYGRYDFRDRPYTPSGIVLLKARNLVRAYVHFSGGNDEGSVHGIELEAADGTKTRLAQHSDWDWKTNQPVSLTPDQIADNELFAALSEPVDRKYDGFAGEFYVSGTFIFDVTKTGNEQVVEHGQRRSYHYDEY